MYDLNKACCPCLQIKAMLDLAMPNGSAMDPTLKLEPVQLNVNNSYPNPGTLTKS
jgi:hypothetical protein